MIWGMVHGVVSSDEVTDVRYFLCKELKLAIPLTTNKQLETQQFLLIIICTLDNVFICGEIYLSTAFYSVIK